MNPVFLDRIAKVQAFGCGLWLYTSSSGFILLILVVANKELLVIRVYHREQLGTQLVAEVMTNDLEDAYRMTQNIEGSWSRTRLLFDRNNRLVENPDFHPEVQVLAKLPVFNGEEYGLRSTMVNDELELVQDATLGTRRYRVAPIGFVQLA